MKESGQIFNVADAHKINTFMKKVLNSTKLLQITLANVFKINPIT